jgi:hypothetical protein
VLTCPGGEKIASSQHKEKQPGGLGTLIQLYILIIGWDALGGYTFARMAQNQGYPVCSLGAAAAAGGVYGALSAIPKIIASYIWGLFYNGIADE